MNDSMQQLMQQATRLTQAGRLGDAAEVIRRALSGLDHGGGFGGSGAMRGSGGASNPPAGTRSEAGSWAARRGGAGDIIDVEMVEMVELHEGHAASSASSASSASAASMLAGAAPTPVPAGSNPPYRDGDDRFIAGRHAAGRVARDYKLFVPARRSAEQASLVVMLHGCTQDPDDFAAGTAMNRWAREQGFLVLYPAQSADANPSRCWNWFKPNHQRRDQGEPAWIASLTRAVIAEHGIDPRRVYVAGLSAGGAMAAILAQAYPDLFAAVGVHSGLAVGSARNVPQALAVMKQGHGVGPAGLPGSVPGPGLSVGGLVSDALSRAGLSRAGLSVGHPSTAASPSDAASGAATAVTATGPRVPIIVFHGDADSTVHPENGRRVMADGVGTPAAAAAAGQPATQVEQGGVPGGRSYTRTVQRDAEGRVLGEYWTVQGMGHAWSGGSSAGSYTDGAGPDASAEMLRFFRDHGCLGGVPR